MTTKRKQILKAIAVSGSATIDDLVMTTGLERKNLHDNVKAALKGELCQRIKDNVTGQPAYKLTPKGRAWLENDKDDTASTKATISKPQPAVGKNSGSKDAGSIVDGGLIGADSLPVGNAVSAPPKPDKMPVAACADVKADPVVRKSLTTEMPTDKECCNAAKVVATTASSHVADLYKEIDGLSDIVDAQRTMIDARDSEIRIGDAAIEGWLRLAKEFECNNIPELRVFINAAVDKLDRLRSVKTDSLKNAHPEPAYSTDDAKPRYIIAENYMTASSEEQANAIALEIAKNIQIDTPVVVFAAYKERELRINWRDA
jgi:hypothetical protein